LARRPDSVVISCEQSLNLDFLVEQLWNYLGLLRIYTKKRGEFPDLEHGLIVRSGASLEHVCHMVHRDLARQFKYALIWGTSAKHQPQKVGLAHRIHDEDVVQIVKKK
jgi:ribosome-interacting GTPase 1